jgi:hypothetical protein
MLATASEEISGRAKSAAQPDSEVADIASRDPEPGFEVVLAPVRIRGQMPEFGPRLPCRRRRALAGADPPNEELRRSAC